LLFGLFDLGDGELAVDANGCKSGDNRAAAQIQAAPVRTKLRTRMLLKFHYDRGSGTVGHEPP
jgi:hypothetical protein